VNRKTKGLGRGLDALLGAEKAPAPAGAPATLPVDRLQAGRYQPRTRMEPEALAELAESIRQQGVIQPILVRPIGPERYEIIAGERRYRASCMAGLTEVPVTVREVADEAALAMALIENIQREDLNPLEEALGVQRLVAEFAFTHEQAAQAIGRSRSATTNLLRLLQLAEPVQALLMGGQLEMGHARALLALPPVEQIRLGQEIASGSLSVREAEALVAATLAAGQDRPNTPRPRPLPDRDLLRLQEELCDRLAAQVDIRTRRGGAGQIRIDYASLDQLQGILQVLRGPAVQDH
jgi:ParB family chromosome partitioning protein